MSCSTSLSCCSPLTPYISSSPAVLLPKREAATPTPLQLRTSSVAQDSVSRGVVQVPSPPVVSASIRPMGLSGNITQGLPIACSPQLPRSDEIESMPFDCLSTILPSFPTALLLIVDEYRSDLSEESIAYIQKSIKANLERGYELLRRTCEVHPDAMTSESVKKLSTECTAQVKSVIAQEPERGYKLLAELIAAKLLNLATFGITAQHIVGLAPHVAILSRVTFDILLSDIEEQSLLHHQILMKILHFADIHHIKEFKRDLHLLGMACDNTQAKIQMRSSDIVKECQKELSRVLIDLSDARAFSDLTGMLGRSSSILFSSHINNAHYRGVMRAIKPGELAQMLSTNSIWDVSYDLLSNEQLTFGTNILVDTLRHLVPSNPNLVECVLVNSYHTIYQSTLEPYRDDLLSIFNDYYNKLFVQTDSDQVEEGFSALLTRLPPRPIALLPHARVPRPQSVVSEFYNSILNQVKPHASTLPEHKEAK